jgi:signal transduction histidine kinase
MIISEHDGQVWAENTAEGPMISFVIPMRTEAIRAAEAGSIRNIALAEAG